MKSFKAQFKGDETAWRYFIAGYRLQMQGRLEEALWHYQMSVDTRPTAEAQTFYGWTLASLGRMEEAIESCKKAIEIDPKLGNPYNDIGAYLIELGRPAEALEWLEKAIQARRYESPHFAWANLASAYEALNDIPRALVAYKSALSLAPEHEPAGRRLISLIASLN